jgi:hypothetical protein
LQKNIFGVIIIEIYNNEERVYEKSIIFIIEPIDGTDFVHGLQPGRQQWRAGSRRRQRWTT